MHWTGVDDRALGDAHVHLGDERKSLVGRGVEVRLEPLPLGRPLRIGAQDVETLVQRRRRSPGADGDRGTRVRPLGGAVLERPLPGLGEEDVDHGPLRRCQYHRLDEFLALVTTAVAADKEDIAEPAHRREGRLGAAERRNLAVLDEDVVERQEDLAMHRRPVVGSGRNHEDVPVQAHLLAVVLADVRVVPVDAGIGELDSVREVTSDRDRRLRLVRAVEAVVEP